MTVAAAVATGILADRYLTECTPLANSWLARSGAWWLLAVACLVAWVLLRRRGQHAAAGALVLGSIVALAGAWHHWQWNVFGANNIGLSATEQSYPCCLEAIALASPQRTAAPPSSAYRAIPQGEKSQLVLRVDRIRNGERWQTASGMCELIVDGHLLGINARDRLRIYGQLRAPSPARNPGQFDYANHMRADRELSYVRCESPDCVTVLSRGSDWNPLRWIDQTRAAWQRRLWNHLDDDLAPLASAIFLGDRNAMPRETVDAYRVTGLLHVLVVSGLHAGILIGCVLGLLRMALLPRRVGLAIAMVLVALYALLTGAHPPVVRAALLAELACLALWLHRNPFAFNSLAIAAVVVLFLNPADLFRTGPQLSFLCVATLLWFSSVRWLPTPTPLQTLIFNARPWYERALLLVSRRVGWTMAATLAVWILSMPLLMHQFHLVSPVAVVACVPVFFTLALSLIAGFVFLVAGWLIPALETSFAWLLSNSLGVLNGMVQSASDWPYAYFWTPGPTGWWVLGWYGLVGVGLCAGGTRFGWRRTVQLAAMWIVIGVAPVIAQRTLHRALQATFLDVGHGVCVVVTTPEGATLLYDAGSLGSPTYATETVSSYLWSRGIRTIDGIVLSHADVDHFNAMPGLVDRFRIGRVFVSPHMFPRVDDPTDHSAPAELQRLLDRHSIPTEVVQLGDRLKLDSSTQALVLYPDWLGSIGNDNANSLVLAIESGPHRILLPGDLESTGIDFVIADEPYPCSVLLAPHHGSRRSNPPGFAAWSQPKTVVISGSATAAESNVVASYQRQGAEVLLTSGSGAIDFVFDAHSVHRVRFRPQSP